MKYTQKSFSVGGSSKAYSDNYDRTFRREIDPAPSECKPGAPKKNADIHDGAELLRTYHIGSNYEGGVRALLPLRMIEVYRCADCGAEWEV